MILSTVKEYRIFSQVTDTIYIISLANRGHFNNYGLNKKIWHASFLSDVMLQTYACQIRQLTSDVSLTAASSSFLNYYKFLLIHSLE